MKNVRFFVWLQKPLGALGTISLEIYLIHVGFNHVRDAYFPQTRAWITICYAVILALSIALGFAIHFVMNRLFPKKPAAKTLPADTPPAAKTPPADTPPAPNERKP